MAGKTFDKSIFNVDKRQPSRSVITNVIEHVQEYRTRQDIGSWRNAIQYAENILFRNRRELYRIYSDVELDSHVKALVQSRKHKTLSKDYCFVDESGEIDEDSTKIIKNIWFKKVLDLCLESKFWGFSLIQLGPIVNDSFSWVELVPRHHVKSEFGIVVQNPGDNDGVSYLESPFANWVLPVGDPYDLGVYLQVAPNYLYKKDNTGNWSDFLHLFGQPMRIGKTDSANPTARSNMEAMLKNMGSKSWAVLDPDDEVEFVETRKDSGNDLYMIFNDWLNSEISKVIFGQTGTSDTKGILKGEVAEKTANEFAISDMHFITDVINMQLVPMMRSHGIQIPETSTFKFKDDVELSPEQKINQVDVLAKYFEIDPDYITKEFGVPVVQPSEAKKKRSDITNVLNLVDDFYGSVCCDIHNNLESDPDLFSDQEIDRILQGIYAGSITIDNLPVELHEKIRNFLSDAVEDTLRNESIEGLENELKKNVFTFSAAQNYQQVKEITSLIVGPDGFVRTFSEFKKDALLVFKKFNKNHLRTEFNLAVAQTQAAALWSNMQDAKDELPLIRYVTAGDERVSDTHRALNGIVRPITDPFWRTYWPPIAWACRCTVTNHASGELEVTPMSEINVPEVPKALIGNAGISKSIYTKEHPYFNVPESDRDLKRNNFNLPFFDE